MSFEPAQPLSRVMSDLDLLTVQRGTVTAPAGCGKTQLIADTLKRHRDARPTLVLTHTNAGKAALEQRLQRAQVSRHAYRVFTIDSWAVRLACRFPARSGVGTSVRQVENPRTDYPAVRTAVARLLRAGHINDPLTSTYGRLFVDEYQDCGLVQHDIVLAVAEVLPTVVFGDPLQAIFTFSGPTVRWKTDVWPEFPDVVQLKRPWRWENVGAQALGQWLLDIRRALSSGQPVDLRQAPAEVIWVRLDGDEAAVHRQRMDAARSKAPNKDGTVIVIGESLNPAGQRRIASVTPGAVVVEAVDLRDFTAFGRAFKPAGSDAFERLISFAADMMTQLSERALLKRVEVLQRGSARTAASPVEEAALAFGRLRVFFVNRFRPRSACLMAVIVADSAESDNSDLHRVVQTFPNRCDRVATDLCAAAWAGDAGAGRPTHLAADYRAMPRGSRTGLIPPAPPSIHADSPLSPTKVWSMTVGTAASAGTQA